MSLPQVMMVAQSIKLIVPPSRRPAMTAPDDWLRRIGRRTRPAQPAEPEPSPAPPRPAKIPAGPRGLAPQPLDFIRSIGRLGRRNAVL
jgi:hypothetical protein